MTVREDEADPLRLFFALWPQPHERDALRTATAPVLAAARGRAVAVENLHLTLAFLGAVPAGRLGELIALGERLVLPSFTLSLDRLGHFSQAQVLWLGPADVPPALLEFEQRLWGELEALGFERRRHETYRPHVTLARRVRRAPRVEPPPAVLWQAGRWALVSSQSGSGGSRYVPQALWPARAEVAPGGENSRLGG